MGINDWVSGSATKDGDTSELSTDEMINAVSLDGDDLPRAALSHDDEDEAFGPGDGSGGPLDTALQFGRDYWYYALAGGAVLILVIVMSTRMLGGPAEAPPAEAPPSNEAAQQEQAGTPEPAGEVQDTGVEFAEPVTENGAYYLRSGEISWKGKVEQSETGEELTLEGPTAAQFKRAVALPHGQIMTGVFGRAQPDQPIVHGTFHRVTLGDRETTTGTYKAVDDQQVLADGYYTDERDGDTVVRTYQETLPQTDEKRSYRVSFEAPAGVPIPTLIGWVPPPLPDSREAG